ncbi:MAG: glutaminase domain-containing protein [Anaerolineae bacterium]
MQPMGDGLSVLGSRHGMMWDPFNRQSYLVRFDKHPGIPFELHAGVRLAGRTIVLPLCPQGEVFAFLDQEMTPGSMVLTGIDPETGIKVRLEVRIPFRPRDAPFSTAPVYYLQASISRLGKPFRWTKPAASVVQGSLFIEIAGSALTASADTHGFNLTLKAPLTRPFGVHTTPANHSGTFQERLEVISGQVTSTGAELPFNLHMGEAGGAIQLAWCACADEVLAVADELCPFKYRAYFSDLSKVTAWARENMTEVYSYGAWFDGVVADHSLGTATTHLLSQTLHSWLINTWWVQVPSHTKDWFSVWEGSCYFHSTVDVEFTQAPFYLTLWPELLKLELDEWPIYAKSGEICLGERGEGTQYLAHDMGVLAACGRQVYPHDMEVEEAANYVLLAYAYWQRSGDAAVQLDHYDTIRRFCDFIQACDTTGNGVPDAGCTNTIDDAAPAIQYGREQVYLAVKALAALRCGAELLHSAGYPLQEDYLAQAEAIRSVLEARGWLGDHYAVTLDPSAEGLVDPWTRQALHGTLPGWDAYHIYTANTLPVLDVVGSDLGLDDERLAQDILNAHQHTLTRYGCSNTYYSSSDSVTLTSDGVAVGSGAIGWVSMNVLRDIAAAYRGVDLLSMAERYWDWQATTNAREVCGFFETFRGNNLCFYPRGVAIWGYLEAAAGLRYSRVTGQREANALRQTTRIPLLALADWRKRSVPYYEA